jgi:ABC-2 type transport system ATP-binding protein
MIQLQNFHFRYDRKKVVFNGLQLSFHPGFIYGLLGKNGTGKSTLFKNICGLLKPTNGHISTLGFTPFDRNPGMLRDVFLLPEEFHVPPIRIQDWARTMAPLYPRFDYALFENLLKEFEIPTDNEMSAMSLGQKKKCLISFSLATNTRILLMDEPTNGLDILSKTQFKQIIRKLNLEGDRCIIISTHQVKDIEDLVNRITVIDSGNILFDENTESISAKLSFESGSQVPDGALFSEPSSRGFDFILAKGSSHGRQPDMELLYKLIMTNPAVVHSVFTPQTTSHERHL